MMSGVSARTCVVVCVLLGVLLSVEGRERKRVSWEIDKKIETGLRVLGGFHIHLVSEEIELD